MMHLLKIMLSFYAIVVLETNFKSISLALFSVITQLVAIAT